MSVLVAIAFANCNPGGVLASKASMADRPPSGDGKSCVTRSEAWAAERYERWGSNPSRGAFPVAH